MLNRPSRRKPSKLRLSAEGLEQRRLLAADISFDFFGDAFFAESSANHGDFAFESAQFGLEFAQFAQPINFGSPMEFGEAFQLDLNGSASHEDLATAFGASTEDMLLVDMTEEAGQIAHTFGFAEFAMPELQDFNHEDMEFGEAIELDLGEDPTPDQLAEALGVAVEDIVFMDVEAEDIAGESAFGFAEFVMPEFQDFNHEDMEFGEAIELELGEDPTPEQLAEALGVTVEDIVFIDVEAEDIATESAFGFAEFVMPEFHDFNHEDMEFGEAIELELGEDPTPEQLAEALGVTVEDIVFMDVEAEDIAGESAFGFAEFVMPEFHDFNHEGMEFGEAIELELGEDPTPEQLAEALGVTVEDIVFMDVEAEDIAGESAFGFAEFVMPEFQDFNHEDMEFGEAIELELGEDPTPEQLAEALGVTVEDIVFIDVEAEDIATESAFGFAEFVMPEFQDFNHEDMEFGEAIELELGEDPTPEQLAEALGVTVEDIVLIDVEAEDIATAATVAESLNESAFGFAEFAMPELQDFNHEDMEFGEAIELELGEDPTPEQLAEALGVAVEDIVLMDVEAEDIAGESAFELVELNEDEQFESTDIELVVAEKLRQDDESTDASKSNDGTEFQSQSVNIANVLFSNVGNTNGTRRSSNLTPSASSSLRDTLFAAFSSDTDENDYRWLF